VRQIYIYLLLFTFLSLLAGIGLISCQAKKRLAHTPERPNIILILTDDLDAASISKIPALKEYMADKGATFSNAFVSEPVCCPSRATILRGQYPHNHMVRRNFPPLGGFDAFHNLGREESTIAAWLNNAAGYRTVFIGEKYLNHYNKTYVPPGWDDWYYAATPHHTLSHNGQVREYPADTYVDDLLSELAQGFVKRKESKSTPFFMYLSAHAPHDPVTPAERYKGLYKEERAPRPPSFNEQDVSDKPRWVGHRSPLSPAEIAWIDTHYRDRLRTMASIGEMVEKLVQALKAAGKLNNTYIVFTSDNGYEQGQHRLDHGKGGAYEESIHVPLMIRGPGVPVGIKRDELVLNNDFAPTLADWAGINPPEFVDGRSFASITDEGSSNDPSSWRTAFEVRYWQESSGGGTPSYQALRTSKYLYVEYESGERELYNLKEDPYELDNFYDTADAALIAELHARLKALRDCSGESCRAAENGA
jgi:N-acetylglucosamine-6-sulfatase